MSRLILIGTTLFMYAGSLASASDWPAYAHDNQRSGVSRDELAWPLAVKWQFQSPAAPAPGWSRPVAGYGARKNKSNVSYDDAFRTICVAGTVYFCSSSENTVYAVDAVTADVKWTFVTGAAPRLAPTYWNGCVYLGADDGRVYCLRADDGSLVWTLDASLTSERILGYGRFLSSWPIRSGVMIEQGVAYFTAGLFPSEGVFLYAVNPETGKVLWRRQIDDRERSGISPQGYLLAAGDSLFMTSRVAPTRWRLEDGASVPFVTPLPDVPKSHEYRYINGGSFARIWDKSNIVYGQAGLLGYDPNGTFTDRYNRTQQGTLLFNWFNARQIVVRGDTAWIATDYHVLAVETKLLSALAKNECYRIEELYKKCRVADRLERVEEYDQIVLKEGEQSERAKTLKNGPLKWSQAGWDEWVAESPRLFDALGSQCRWMQQLCATESMVLTANALVVGSNDALYALDANTGDTLWSDDIGTRVRGLTVSDGRLLVSGIDGSIRCYAHEGSPESITTIQVRPVVNIADTETVTTEQEVIDALLAEGAYAKGYCLILGGGTGHLAAELARHTGLTIEVLEEDQASMDRQRMALGAAGLYGHRVAISSCAADMEKLPYPPYVFNLILDLDPAGDRPGAVPVDELLRCTRPGGGKVVLGARRGATESLPVLRDVGSSVTQGTRWTRIVRGALSGAGDWTHNYATAANTYCSEDQLVKGPFGISWYGEPGPSERIDRHATGPMPLVVGGTMFTTGYDRVMAYDIYNGIKYWEREIAGVTRTGLPLGTSNLVADSTSLFAVVDNRQCWRLAAHSGQTLAKYDPPGRDGQQTSCWGWIALEGDLLLGSRTLLDQRRRQADSKYSDEVFAIDINTGKLRWQYRCGKVEHDGIAVCEGRLFLVTKELSEEEQERAVTTIPKDRTVKDRSAVDRRGNAIQPDLRKLIALDVLTGQLVWGQPFDASDITLDDNAISDGRVAVACMVKENVVVVHGTGSLGHPHQEFLAGEFARRALYAFSSGNGKWLWGGRRNYRKRPIIVGDFVYAEPFAWNLQTGKLKTIANPLTGEAQVLDLHRGYIGCSHLLASGAALFGNKVGIGYYNLDCREGFHAFSGMSLACGLGAVPAGGLFVAPEGRSGCTCAAPIHTSIVLYPRERSRSWGLGTDGGMVGVNSLPVKHAFVNLGGPGYREDDQHRLWIPYPGRVGTGLIGDWLPSYQHDADMFYCYPEELFEVTGSDRPWLFTSGYHDTKEFRFPLRAADQEAAKYTVTLYFAEPEELSAGERVFSVELQGATVLRDFDVVAASGGYRRALTRQFTGVEVQSDLLIRLQPSSQTRATRPPILCAFEAVRE